MLVELVVRDLGVIAEARIPFDGGMTALTGETGAGKTMLIEALRLLCGDKADPSRVAAGADEAVVEALFEVPDRSYWRSRSRCGARAAPCRACGWSITLLPQRRAVPAARLAEIAADARGDPRPTGQQALLDLRHQRAALDRFAGVDRSRLELADESWPHWSATSQPSAATNGTRSRQVGPAGVPDRRDRGGCSSYRRAGRAVRRRGSSGRSGCRIERRRSKPPRC